nr:MAG TPA: hypothetical protein [Caudoviricetes sp.]
MANFILFTECPYLYPINRSMKSVIYGNIFFNIIVYFC